VTACLQGIKVLDFGHVLAGPYCGRLLADLGADVVRVESAAHPDNIGAARLARSRRRTDRTPTFLMVNRNKRSVALDLKTEPGRLMAARLAETADVVIENYSAGVMKRLGLDEESVALDNPRVIYVSMSGYGSGGPHSSWASMNMNLQAYSGLMKATGGRDDPPTAIGNSWADYMGGLHACAAVLSGLHARRVTGRGAFFDLSQFECSVAMLEALVTQVPYRDPRPSNRSTAVAPQGCYACGSPSDDDWCVLTVEDDTQWRALATLVADHLPDDAGTWSLQRRQEEHDRIDDAVSRWTSGRSAIDAEAALVAAGVPAARVVKAAELLGNSDTFRQQADTFEDGIPVTGFPVRFSDRSPVLPATAPRMGEHTGQVLRDWLGMSTTETQAFIASPAAR
jgi:formyl-CoA transferase